MKKRVTLRKRIRYWLERRMAKGTSSMVKLLLFAVLFMVILVTVLVLVFNLQKEGKSIPALFWDNLRAAMSSSFPSSESGPLLHIILYTLLGLTGMIFTGMLIGIFSTSMRGKILALQKENPEILDKGHVVILGFRPGEYALLEQMIQAAWGEKRTIVVVEKMERVDMERYIRTNVKVPKNIRLVVINAETESAAALQCCAIEAAETVVIYTRDSGRTVKTYLAVETLLRNAKKRPKIVTTVDSGTSSLNDELLPGKEISVLHSGNVVARIVAHAATQPGIFEAFLDMIDFNNFEFYFEKREELYGLPFWKAVLAATRGIVVGLYRDGKVILDPEQDTTIRQDDLLAVFEEEQGDLKLVDLGKAELAEKKTFRKPDPIEEVVVMGVHSEILTVLRELPDYIRRIRLIGLNAQEFASLIPKDEVFSSEILPDYRNVESEAVLTEIVRNAAHLIILSDRRKKPEEADTETMVRIMRLRSIQQKQHLHFTITAEMRCENNRKLIAEDRTEDFIVASDLSSMLLAQVTEDTKRLSLFNDLLDEHGSEVYLLPASEFELLGETLTARELRKRVYAYGYILIGIRTAQNAFKVLDDNAKLVFGTEDKLILIGEG